MRWWRSYPRDRWGGYAGGKFTGFDAKMLAAAMQPPANVPGKPKLASSSKQSRPAKSD